mgnify:CR=1 FL=1
MAHIIKSHIVPEGIAPIRLSDYAFLIFGDLSSRKGIKKAIKRGEIRVNGQLAPTGTWVQPGQRIEMLDLELKPPKPYRLVLEIVFEDDDLAVINKPAGIVVSGNQYRTIENSLSGNLKNSPKKDALKWPRPVHRLDSPTSGLLLVAKTARARIALGHQLEQKTIDKRYRAIVSGAVPPKGKVEKSIEGKLAITHFECLQKVPSLKNEWLSLLDLYPETGRTHQLRKHMAGMGHPIMGDQLYGIEGNVLKGKGLFLAAIGLSFLHPTSNRPIKLDIDMPGKFQSLLDREERRWKKYNA